MAAARREIRSPPGVFYALMPLRLSPLPDDEPPIDLPTFLHRLKTEPAFAAKMRAHYEAALALPLTPETEALHASARKALATLKHHQGALHARRRLAEVAAWLDSGRDQAELPQISALMDEAVDEMLDVLEPERTKYLTRILEMRAALQELAEET